MIAYFRFRFQRQLRRTRRDFRLLKTWSVNYLNRHVWGKWRQLGIIRRLVVVWWGLLIILAVAVNNQTNQLEWHYLVAAPLPGGVYAEGMVGRVKVINPILPENALAADAARLIFSGLVKYGPNRGIEPDLAESWNVSDDGLIYTFKLRQDVAWHDGVPFKSRDVVFTMTAIQHPDSRSPLAGDWQGITVEAKDDYTVTFTLPDPYVPFINFATVGILPSHMLESIDPSTLRLHDFNQKPVGTGPFKVKQFVAGGDRIVLESYAGYHGGRPQLDGFIFHFYDDAQQALDGFAKRQVNAVSRVPAEYAEEAKRIGRLHLAVFGLPDQTNLFFRTTAAPLDDNNVRLALVKATDKQQIARQVFRDFARPLSAPLLPGQLGYDIGLLQSGPDLTEAKRLLDEAGWQTARDGIRVKDGKSLNLTLVTQQGGETSQAAELVREQWARVGANVEVKAVEQKELIQSHIRPRQYDVLLYGINIGADPDVYPYWHSSQVKDPGLNLSQYSSKEADAALEVARITVDPDIRAGKYKSFLKAWQSDAPAVILYTQDYVYAVSKDVMGITAENLVTPADRFYGVEEWTVRTRQVMRVQN